MASSAPVAAVSALGGGSSSASAQDTAKNAFGLGFEDLLHIVLTQLTYQDPLKPVENFEFVSQLAQFTQIQQTQTMSDNTQSLVSASAADQATSLLGRTVDIPSSAGTVTGVVKSIVFQSGAPRLTVLTSTNQTITNVDLSAISRIAPGN